MSETLQLIIVGVIVVAAIIGLVLRSRRRGSGCCDCDSPNCPNRRK
jgi:preprotein translocase subunit SecG